MKRPNWDPRFRRKPRYGALDLKRPDHRYVARRQLVWLKRLIKVGWPLEVPLLVWAVWLLGPEGEGVVRELRPKKKDKKRRRIRDEERLLGYSTLEPLRRIPPIRVDERQVVRLCLAVRDETRARRVLLEAIDRRRAELGGKCKSRLKRNLDWLKQTFGLKRVGGDLLLI